MALYHTFTLWLFNIAMENGPFIDDEHDDLPIFFLKKKKVFSHRKVAGWWLSHPSEKYDFVSWDDDIPN